MFKSCSKCSLELHIDMFSKSKKGLLGRCSICKSCRNKEAVIYRDINSDRISSNKKIPLSSNIDINLSHYTNLQPLCSKVNRDIKRDIYTTHH
jgi:hypothetical protein